MPHKMPLDNEDLKLSLIGLFKAQTGIPPSDEMVFNMTQRFIKIMMDPMSDTMDRVVSWGVVEYRKSEYYDPLLRVTDPDQDPKPAKKLDTRPLPRFHTVHSQIPGPKQEPPSAPKPEPPPAPALGEYRPHKDRYKYLD